MPSQRRFPPPWSVQKTEGSHFKISDANGFALAYVYAKDNRAGGYDGLTEDEARRDRGEHRQAAGAAAGSSDRSLPIARLGWSVRLPPDELAALDKFMLEHPDKLLRPLRIRYDFREWLRSSGCLSGGDNE